MNYNLAGYIQVSVCVLSHFNFVQLFMTLWIAAHQDPLSMGFSKQEYWSGLPSFSRGSSRPRDWTCICCIAGRFFTIWATREAHLSHIIKYNLLKVLLFSPIFNIKMAAQKCINFDFLKNAYWYDSCHNTV